MSKSKQISGAEYIEFTKNIFAPAPSMCLYDPAAWYKIMHAAYGLQGEAIELLIETDPEEELGDIIYYLTRLSEFIHNQYSMPIVTVPALDPVGLDVRQLVSYIEVVCNMVKKVFIYQQDKVLDLKKALVNLWVYLYKSVNVPAIKQANYEKLSIRYPDAAFSTTHSEQRLDKA